MHTQLSPTIRSIPTEYDVLVIYYLFLEDYMVNLQGNPSCNMYRKGMMDEKKKILFWFCQLLMITVRWEIHLVICTERG